MIARTLLLTTLLSAGCGGADSTPPAPAVAPPVPAPAAPAPDAHAKNKALTPSPLRLEREVREAGITGALAGLVQPRVYDMTVQDPDVVAVRTGVVLARTVLAGKDAPKEEFLAQLHQVRDGMAALGTGEGLLATIDDFIKNVENDAAAREDFLEELDGVAGMMVPEEGWGPGDRTGPMLQAGAWLAGTNLVAKAIVKSGNAEAAEKLLRRKEIAEYFLGYIQTEGAEKAGPLAASLILTLEQLRDIASKPTITLADAQAVADSTEALFKFL